MDPIAPDIAACEPSVAGLARLRHDTERLTLRPLRPEDAETFVLLLSDEAVSAETAAIPFPYRLEDAHGFIARVAAETAQGRALVFAVLDRLSGRLEGCVGASITGAAAEIGYWFGRAYWGQGHATEAVRHCLRLLFRQCGVTLAWASVLPSNQASRHVLDKVGFSYDCARDVALPARGRTARLDFLTLTRAAWQEADAARPLLLVAAAALIDIDGRVLLAQRPEGRRMAGQWEFPGGKVEPGESPEAALIRELKEELDIDIAASCLAPLTFASHDYDGFRLLMPLYACRHWRGTPLAREGQVLAWARPRDMAGYPMPPADLPLVAWLGDWL